MPDPDSPQPVPGTAAWLLGSVYLLYYLVIGPFQLILRGRCEAAGLGADAGVWALGFLYVALAVGRLIAGPVTERLDARRTLIVTGLLLALAIGMTFNVSHRIPLYLGLTLIGLASALLWSAGGAFSLALATAGRHGTAASRLYVFTGIGMLAGALMVDLFLRGDAPYGSAGFAWLQVLWLLAACLVMAAAWGLPAVTRAVAKLIQPLQVMHRLHRAGGGWLFGILAGAAISYGVFYALVTELVRDVPAVSRFLGTISLPLYAIMAFSSLLVGPLSDRIGRRPVIVQGMLAGGIGFAMLGGVAMRPELAPVGAWILVGGGCLGLGWCFASVQTMSMAWIGDHLDLHDRSTGIGLLFIGRDLGVTLAAAVSLFAVRAGTLAGWGDGKAFALIAFAIVLFALTPLTCKLRPRARAR